MPFPCRECVGSLPWGTAHCAIYPKKGERTLACHALPGTEQITFGHEGLTRVRLGKRDCLLERLIGRLDAYSVK